MPQRIFEWWRISPFALKLGATTSGVWSALLFAYTWAKFPDLMSKPPNELGDFIAGAAAPLAFLWLVVAVFLQKEQLRLQHDELKESVAAQKQQANETAKLVKQSAASTKAAIDALNIQLNKAAADELDSVVSSLITQIEGGGLEVLHLATNPRVSLATLPESRYEILKMGVSIIERWKVNGNPGYANSANVRTSILQMKRSTERVIEIVSQRPHLDASLGVRLSDVEYLDTAFQEILDQGTKTPRSI